jgi:hypothetical protein
MSALAASAVSVTDTGYTGGVNGKKYRTREVVLTLTGQGTAANPIPASVLKLTEIVGCTPLVQDDDTDIVVAAPDYAGENLLLKAAGSNAPADYTGTFRGIVYGHN